MPFSFGEVILRSLENQQQVDLAQQRIDEEKAARQAEQDYRNQQLGLQRQELKMKEDQITEETRRYQEAKARDLATNPSFPLSGELGKFVAKYAGVELDPTKTYPQNVIATWHNMALGNAEAESRRLQNEMLKIQSEAAKEALRSNFNTLQMMMQAQRHGQELAGFALPDKSKLTPMVSTGKMDALLGFATGKLEEQAYKTERQGIKVSDANFDVVKPLFAQAEAFANKMGTALLDLKGAEYGPVAGQVQAVVQQLQQYSTPQYGDPDAEGKRPILYDPSQYFTQRRIQQMKALEQRLIGNASAAVVAAQTGQVYDYAKANEKPPKTAKASTVKTGQIAKVATKKQK